MGLRDRFTQYFYFRKPAKDISPRGGRPPPEPLPPSWGWSAGCLGAMFPLFPLVGGVFLPQFVPSPAGGPHRGPPFALVLVAYGAVFLQFARQYLRLRREV